MPSIGFPGYPYFCSTWLQSGAPITLLQGFDNLLEWLTKLGKAYYILLPVYYKDTMQEWPNGRDAWVRYGMKNEELHVLSVYTTLPAPGFVHQPGSSLNTIFCKFLWMFHYVGMVDDTIWPLAIISSPTLLSLWGVRLKVPTSNQGLVFLMTKLPGVLPRVARLKVTLLKDVPITFIILDSPRVLEAVCQEWRTKIKYLFMISQEELNKCH